MRRALQPELHAPKAFLAVCCLLVFSSSSWAQERSIAACRSYKQCSAAGTNALRKGKIDAAIRWFKLQAAYAEAADVRLSHASRGPGETLYPLAILAYNNLALANMRKGNYIFARIWCHQTLFWEKTNSTALRYRGEIEQKLKNWKWPKSPTGLYVQYAGDARWQTVCVIKKSSQRLRVSFHGFRALDENSGELVGTFTLSDGLAVYGGDQDFPECRVHMRLLPGRALLEQKGECGFGYGVSASGTFLRMNASPKCVMP